MDDRGTSSECSPGVHLLQMQEIMKLPFCQCMVNGLSCTQACTLQDCEIMNDDDVGAMQEEGSDIDCYSGTQ